MLGMLCEIQRYMQCLMTLPSEVVQLGSVHTSCRMTYTSQKVAESWQHSNRISIFFPS